MRAKVPDVRTGEPISIDLVQKVFPNYGDEVILQQVHMMVRKLEEHETNEWFKVDGKCYKEPHPEVKKEAI